MTKPPVVRNHLLYECAHGTMKWLYLCFARGSLHMQGTNGRMWGLMRQNGRNAGNTGNKGARGNGRVDEW